MSRLGELKNLRQQMIKKIIIELLYFLVAFISSLCIVIFLQLFNFGGSAMNNKFYQAVIFRNFIVAPIQSLFFFWLVIYFGIILIQQRKLNIDNSIPNLKIIIVGVATICFCNKYIYDTIRFKEILRSESINYDFTFYNCGIILFICIEIIFIRKIIIAFKKIGYFKTV
jgi:hypothetical protein